MRKRPFTPQRRGRSCGLNRRLMFQVFHMGGAGLKQQQDTPTRALLYPSGEYCVQLAIIPSVVNERSCSVVAPSQKC
jgi:hypothetical protein